MATKTKIDVPNEVRFEIELRAILRDASLQQVLFKHLKFYALSHNNGVPKIIDPEGQDIFHVQPDAPYQFVVLKKEDHLELRISKGHHNVISNEAKSVAAAGDIYTTKGIITKITDQSGSYYIPNTDPLFCQKQQSAKAAMKAVGLPVNRFVPFSTPKPLVFSSMPNNKTIATKIEEKQEDRQIARETYSA